MVLKFKKASFLVPVNFNGMYQGAFYFLGLVLEINDYEQCLLFPIRIALDDGDDGVGVCWLSVPAVVDTLEAYQDLASMGGNVLTTPIMKLDELPSDDLLIQWPLRDGEMESSLSLSNFAATLRTESSLTDLTVTPAGFLKLAPQTTAAALAR